VKDRANQPAATNSSRPTGGTSTPGKGTPSQHRYNGVSTPVQRKEATSITASATPHAPDFFGGVLDQPIMRKAAAGAVAPNATSALSDAASSSGQSLPPELQGKLARP